MERQITAEKSRINAVEAIRERELKKNMETLASDLDAKERVLYESQAKQAQMERQLQELNVTEFEQKCANEKLQRENAYLEER